ncbi:uncharacterized protein KD926_010523 [Aspergillus affinis]|uniref:uncharacterized protein n=1 Tax=Aspergillus affinis TaxID=1070780 RepID=UPI0022FEA647|nr:uncharacterized protein KD926_010523 [Aspergillus affinis]KAI9038683.1 hypothetical protein KD926_010523 [Aspergillus affinis]
MMQKFHSSGCFKGTFTMSVVHDSLNQCLLKDTWDLYRMYKDSEDVVILADNVRTFEGGRHYREAAISAFVARQIASAVNPEIREISHFSHPNTYQWYDRLMGLCPDLFASRVQSSQAGASSIDETSSVVANAEDSGTSTPLPTDTFTNGTTTAEHSNVHWESSQSAEGDRMGTANETYGTPNDYTSDIDETIGALELNTSSDWYQPPATNETPNCGRRRRAHRAFYGSVPVHNPSRIGIDENETHQIINRGIVITEGGSHFL